MIGNRPQSVTRPKVKKEEIQIKHKQTHESDLWRSPDLREKKKGYQCQSNAHDQKQWTAKNWGGCRGKEAGVNLRAQRIPRIFHTPDAEIASFQSLRKSCATEPKFTKKRYPHKRLSSKQPIVGREPRIAEGFFTLRCGDPRNSRRRPMIIHTHLVIRVQRTQPKYELKLKIWGTSRE